MLVINSVKGKTVGIIRIYPVILEIQGLLISKFLSQFKSQWIALEVVNLKIISHVPPHHVP